MIQIKRWYNGEVIFEANVSTMKEAVELAVKQKVSLASAYLPGANLRNAYLRGVVFRWASLQGAKLEGADLTGADIRWTDLRGAKLEGTDLTGADLRNAWF